jgi:hypothetical protein
LLTGGLAAAAVLSIGSSIALFSSANPLATLARLRGEVVTLDPAISEIGDGVAGEDRTVTVKVTNHGRKPVRLIGGTGRAIDLNEDLPLTLVPGQGHPIRITMRFFGGSGVFQRSFMFYTDDYTHGPITGRISGCVTEDLKQSTGASAVDGSEAKKHGP